MKKRIKPMRVENSVVELLYENTHSFTIVGGVIQCENHDVGLMTKRKYKYHLKKYHD